MSVFDTASDIQWGTRSAFKGAELTRLYSDRWPAANHPDTEIQHSLRSLRAASRDLFRNNPFAAGLGEAVADNVSGWTGIRCKPVPERADQEIAREVRWAIEDAWEDWGENYATVDGVESWLETERLIDRSWVQDGEVFIRRRRGWGNPHAYAVELIDPDLLDEEYNESRDRTGREIVMGVEIDPNGRPLAYHFWTEHPDEIGFRRERVRVPASEILHYFIRQRPGQTRGYPLLSPAITRFEMADGYEEAELVAARYHASKMGFIKNVSADAIQAWAARMSLQNQTGRGTARRRIKVGPGLIEELDPGQEFQGFDPTHPNDAFEPFLKSVLRGIARCASISYLTFTGDVAEANYSSMRAGLIPERDHWKVLQGVKFRRVCRPVHLDWRSMALLSGALRIPRSEARYRIKPAGRRWQWVDPANDLEATETEIKLGLTSRQRAAEERGHDYEVVIDESKADMEYARAAGVYVGGVNTPTAKRGAEATPNNNASGNGASASRSRLAPYTGA